MRTAVRISLIVLAAMVALASGADYKGVNTALGKVDKTLQVPEERPNFHADLQGLYGRWNSPLVTSLFIPL